jgi:threonine dehydrogenase-like Zn-dependent dehydrogenase
LQYHAWRYHRHLGLRAGWAICHSQRVSFRRRTLIAIDTVPERLQLARAAGAEILDFRKEDIYDRIQDLTSGRGADACIDAVGTEPDTGAWIPWLIESKSQLSSEQNVLRQAIHCCRNFGTVSIVGVYGGFLDKIPMGSAIK